MGLEQSTTPEQKQKDEARTEAYKRAKDYALKLFNEKNQEDIDNTYSEIRAFAGIAELDSELIIKEINKGLTLEDPEEFVNLAFGLLKEIIDKKIEHPELFETIQNERGAPDNVFLSKLIYCKFDFENGLVFIHVAPNEDLKLGGIIKSFREGFKELAKLVKEDERIKEVRATSWIVASNPKLLELFGFVVDGPISEEVRIAHFQNEKRPVWEAHMSREALLEKYSKFKNRDS